MKPRINQVVFFGERAAIVVKPEVLGRSFVIVRWADTGLIEAVRVSGLKR